MFSSGVPTVTRRQFSSRGQLEQSRISTLRSTRPCQTVCPSRAPGRTRNSTKLAPLGNTSSGSSPSAVVIRSRSATMCSTRSFMSSENRSARRPAICLTASRWYGSTTLSSSATSHVGPTRYPSLAPAIDQVFENVRVTTRGRSSATRSSALQSANCAYASSTTTRPGARASSCSTRSTGSTRPVGLFGEVRNTTWGWNSVITRSTSAGSSVKSAARSPSTTVAPVTLAIWACIWYVGSKVATVRPGPAYASSTVCSTSFEPFATNTCAASTPWSSAMAARNAVAARSGYRCHSTRDISAATASRNAAGGGSGDSLVLSLTRTSTWAEW